MRNIIRRCVFLLFCATGLWIAICFESAARAKAEPVPPTVQVVETTADRSKLLEPQASISFKKNGNSLPLAVEVDDSKQYQQIDGFGGSLTDSSAWLIWNKLTRSERSELMQKFFSTTSGIGVSFLRLPMGATDFSANGNYSYDDSPSGPDPELKLFSIKHDSTYIIPLLKEALAINPHLKFVALPWSPPAWMKLSGTMNGRTMNGGTMNGGRMNSTYFSSLARYFVDFLRAYQQEGIPIYALSVQNEPLYSSTGYPTEYLPADEEATFIAQHLGPALRKAGFGNVKIFGYEHNWDNTDYPSSLLASAAASYLAGISFHCYAGDPSAQSTLKTKFPSVNIWFTECTGITSTMFANDLAWNAHNLLIGATRNWARSVSLWNLALDQDSGPKNGTCSNCRGVVTINDSVSPAQITLNVEYYILGHLGKFVAPGAHRIGSNTFGAGSIEDVAFQNPDGAVTVFALNGAKKTEAFTVSFHGQSFDYSLPAGAVATFRWK